MEEENELTGRDDEDLGWSWEAVPYTTQHNIR
jgi:hypothetical protein